MLQNSQRIAPDTQLHPLQAEEASILTQSGKQQAGRIQFFFEKWALMTQNKSSLNWVRAYKIPFFKQPLQKRFQKKVSSIYQKSVLLKKINIFLRKKTNEKYRFILNLKKLNSFLDCPHFKLDDFRTVKNHISENCYMAKIDLKDPYFSIPVHKKYIKYSKFQYKNQLYEFTCLPFRLTIGPFIFT
nr:unnamed protein product [Callosobruchus chinensis]